MAYRLLCDNLWDTALYELHVVSADEEATDFEAFRVADGRRDETSWKPNTPNVAHWNRVDAQVARAADLWFLDRGHNLAGILGVALETSPDGTTWTARKTVTIPASAGGTITDTNGMVNDEGAFGALFTSVSARFWRVNVPAMGAGLVPNLSGVHVGTSIAPVRGLPFPVAERRGEVLFEELESRAGRVGRTRPVFRRRDMIVVRANSLAEYETTLQRHLEKFYREIGAPAWFILDTARQPQSTIQVIPPSGDWAFTTDEGVWPFPVAQVPYMENAPVAA